jgi:hypothetical protein
MTVMTDDQLRDTLVQQGIPADLVGIILDPRKITLRFDLRRGALDISEFVAGIGYLRALNFREGMQERALREGVQKLVDNYARFKGHYRVPLEAFGELRLDIYDDFERKGYTIKEPIVGPPDRVIGPCHLSARDLKLVSPAGH